MGERAHYQLTGEIRIPLWPPEVRFGSLDTFPRVIEDATQYLGMVGDGYYAWFATQSISFIMPTIPTIGRVSFGGDVLRRWLVSYCDSFAFHIISLLLPFDGFELACLFLQLRACPNLIVVNWAKHEAMTRRLDVLERDCAYHLQYYVSFPLFLFIFLAILYLWLIKFFL